MKQNIIIETICFLLILLFVYAAVSKLFEYHFFQRQLERSPLLFHLSKAAWTLPFTELVTAVLLSIKAYRITGLLFSMCLLALFSIYIGGMLLFSRNLPCACGGVLKQLSWKQHLLFNLFFFGITVWGIILEHNRYKNTCAHRQHIK